GLDLLVDLELPALVAQPLQRVLADVGGGEDAEGHGVSRRLAVHARRIRLSPEGRELRSTSPKSKEEGARFLRGGSLHDGPMPDQLLNQAASIDLLATQHESTDIVPCDQCKFGRVAPYPDVMRYQCKAIGANVRQPCCIVGAGYEGSQKCARHSLQMP